MTRVIAAPPVDRVIRLADGRALASAEWGDPHGRPVHLFHGRPGSRLPCPDEDTTRTEGVRLVTVDRPGYGGRIRGPVAPSSTGRTTSWHWPTGWSCLSSLSSGGRAEARTRWHARPAYPSASIAWAWPLPRDHRMRSPAKWEDLSPEFRSLVERLRQDVVGALPDIWGEAHHLFGRGPSCRARPLGRDVGGPSLGIVGGPPMPETTYTVTGSAVHS
jgi:hypothetical protein